MEDAEASLKASLNKLVDDNIAQSLRMLSTNADVSFRQSYGRFLLRALHQPIDRVLNDICTIVSTLLVVSEDKEATVRSSLLAEIPDIVIKCRELNVEDVDRFIYDRLLDIMLQFLEDVDPQLRKNAFYAVKHLLEKSVLDEQRVLEKICPAIIGLSNLPFKNHDVDYYTNAIELMALLASIIGQSNTEKQLLDRFCEMCEDEVYSIRRWCADYMPVFCHVLCQTITEERLLPIFKLLCEDSVWGVRKSAAKSLPKVALICSLQRRRDVLAPIAFNLLNDSSRFVSGSAFKNLGQFIATFAQPCGIELEYGSSGKLYITAKLNDTKSQTSWSENEENSLPQYRCDDSCAALESMEHNPFRMFLTGIQSINPSELMNMNRQRVNKRNFEHTENSNILMDQQPQILQQKMSNDLNEDDDMPSSSGCSSASSTDGCYDNANSEDVIKIDIVEKDKLTETKNCDSANGKCDLKDNTNKEEEYTDDFYDSFPNDILEQLPDGLREVIAQIRETTHADIRQRNKESRLRMLHELEVTRNIKRAELRAKFLGKPSPIVLNGPINPPPVPNQSHHPCVDIGGLTKPLIIFPWKLRAKINKQKSGADVFTIDVSTTAPSKTDTTSKEIPQSDSNSLVIDDTKVTLRKKGTSQINEDEESVVVDNFLNFVNKTKVAFSKNENSQINEKEEDSVKLIDDANDELKEFNSLNYWYISPTIDVENELKTLNNMNTHVEELPVTRDQIVHNSNINRVYDMFEIPANDANDNIHKQKLEKLKANCIGPTQDPKFSYFNQPIVPPYLIEYFVSMEHFADGDFNMYCVYNFPAVVLTLKKENWYLMYDLLLFLAGDIQWKVRKTIAMFICDIAVIIGRENTHRDLMPIFLGFFKDLEEVKIEALKNLPMFLSVIDVEVHPVVIANLGECLQCDNDSNWRFREELARQLLHLIKTYGHVYNVEYMIYVTGMAITLLTDKVSAVRTVAMDAIAEKFCTSTPLEFEYLVDFLVEDFARHEHWRRRQMFINICQELISKNNSPSHDVFESNFLPHILELAKDKIPNIRLAVVRLLSLLLYTYIPSKSKHQYEEYTSDEHPVMQTMKKLQDDVDVDVSYVANNR